MPLVVPILRVAMLFLNVYESFKTLKAPQPSARSGGRSSVRAVSQRKRDMKGCLAVWVVWCCFTSYERLLEGIVSLFIPFYDELKSLVLLFLILTRARGAEPIYLHLIRPLLKPYTDTLDSLLDLTCMIGDILFLLSTYPLRLAFSWWHHSFTHNDAEALDSENDLRDHGTSHEDHEVPGNGNLERSNSELLSHERFPSAPPNRLNTVRVPGQANSDRRQLGESARQPSAESTRSSVRTRRQALETGMAPRITQAAGNSQIRSLINPRPQPSGQSNGSASQNHQIWHPPPSAYNDPSDVEGTLQEHPLPSNSDGNGIPNASNIQSNSPPESEENSRERQQLEEWRQYPAFPSAYPPTPLVTLPRLPSEPSQSRDITSRSRRRSGTVQISSIPEELQQQDFGRSLLPPREPLNPGLVGSMSDDDSSSFGIQNDERPGGDPRIDGDDENEEDEDKEISEDFDVTFRTPLPPFGGSRSRIYTRSAEMASIASSSVSSLPSQATALTTADTGSSLRTRTSSESSSSLSFSDSLAIPRRKRSFPRNNLTNVRGRARAFERAASKTPSRGRTVIKRKPRRKPSERMTISQQIINGMGNNENVELNSDAIDSDTPDDEEGISDIPPETKRRRVLPPPSRTATVLPSQIARAETKEVRDAPGPPVQQTKSLGGPRTGSRTSSRLRAGPAATRSRGNTTQSAPDVSSSSLPAPRRASERTTTKK